MIELIPLARLQEFTIVSVPFWHGIITILFVLIDKADLPFAEACIDIVRCTSVASPQPTKVHLIYDLIFVLTVIHVVLTVQQAHVGGGLRHSDVIWYEGVA